MKASDITTPIRESEDLIRELKTVTDLIGDCGVSTTDLVNTMKLARITKMQACLMRVITTAAGNPEDLRNKVRGEIRDAENKIDDTTWQFKDSVPLALYLRCQDIISAKRRR